MAESVYRVTELVGTSTEFLGEGGAARDRDRVVVAAGSSRCRGRQARHDRRERQGRALPHPYQRLLQVRERVAALAPFLGHSSPDVHGPPAGDRPLDVHGSGSSPRVHGIRRGQAVGAAHARSARARADAGASRHRARGRRRARADARPAGTRSFRPPRRHVRIFDRVVRGRCDRSPGPSRHRRSGGRRDVARCQCHARDRAQSAAASARHDHRDAGARERAGRLGDRVRSAARGAALRWAPDAAGCRRPARHPALGAALLGERGARRHPPGSRPQRRRAQGPVLQPHRSVQRAATRDAGCRRW